MTAVGIATALIGAAWHGTIASATPRRNLLAPETTPPPRPAFYFDSYNMHRWILGSLSTELFSLLDEVGGD